MKKVKYHCQLNQAYHAGAMTAKLHNIFHRRNDLPSIVLCMREFRQLKLVFGKYYNLLKNNRYGNSYVVKYEEFDKLGLDRTLIGSYSDYMIGYGDTIKRRQIR